jgi:D-cysteine desulfhydrase
MRNGAREVVTLGAAGSNHALATAIHAGRLGFAVTLFLFPQPASGHVRRNLLLDHHFGARMHAATDPAAALAMAEAYVAGREAATGVRPYLIPFGGTGAITAAGMIDAGLELAMQVYQGQCTVPDVAYLALGSMGTACGVSLGLAAGGAPTRVKAVKVIDDPRVSQEALDALIDETRDTMCAFDSACDCTIAMMLNVRVIEGFVGPGYGLTDERTQAALDIARAAGLVLDETYTAKAFAALLADAASGSLADLCVVFWDTFDSHDFASEVAAVDPAELPGEFAAYLD